MMKKFQQPLAKLSLTPIRRHQRSKSHRYYYQTECLDCELILSIHWEQEYTGVLPCHHHVRIKKECQFCGNSRIATYKIHEPEYLKVNQQWDMVSLAEEKGDNQNDWLSWIQCEVE